MDQSSNKPLDRADELMRKVANDDFKAFERLHQRYAPILMYMAAKRLRSTSSGQGLDPDTADDLVQRIFFSLWQQRKNFRADFSFETYLFSIAKHTMNKELRRFYKMAEREVKDASESTQGSYTGLSAPEAELHLQELTEAIEVAKAKLTPVQRKVLVASMAGEVPSAKTLEELGCSHKAYKSRLQRARKKLKELLAPFFEEDRYT